MIRQPSLAGMVDQAKTWLQKRTVQRGMDGLTGSIMLFFGFKLAIDR